MSAYFSLAFRVRLDRTHLVGLVEQVASKRRLRSHDRNANEKPIFTPLESVSTYFSIFRKVLEYTDVGTRWRTAGCRLEHSRFPPFLWLSGRVARKHGGLVSLGRVTSLFPALRRRATDDR